MKHRVCPVWVGYLLASPLRKLLQDPLKILGPHVTPGMKVMDIGSAMGFFSLPLAKLVGRDGRVICVDLQPKMLQVLTRRARRAGVSERMEARPCAAESLGVQDFASQMDFVLAFAVVHEAAHPTRFIEEIARVMKPGGRLLLAEPKGHVSETDFQGTIAVAKGAGLRIVDSPKILRSRAVLLQRD